MAACVRRRGVSRPYLGVRMILVPCRSCLPWIIFDLSRLVWRFRGVPWRSVHRFVVAHGGALVKLEQLSWRAEAATVSASVQCALISGRQLQQQDRRPIRARVACRVSALRSFQLSSQGVRQSRACSVRLVPGSQNHAERALLWARRRVWQRRGVRGGVKLACVHGRCCAAAFAVAGLRAQARPASLTGRAWAGRRQAWYRASSHLFFHSLLSGR